MAINAVLLGVNLIVWRLYLHLHHPRERLVDLEILVLREKRVILEVQAVKVMWVSGENRELQELMDSKVKEVCLVPKVSRVLLGPLLQHPLSDLVDQTQ